MVQNENYSPLTDHNHPMTFPPCSVPSDQLPLISHTGVGLKGDDYKVRVIEPDSPQATYLEGMRYDHATREWTSDWISENINGGKLVYQYNLRPYTIPQTFTITFKLDRPGRPEWQWTTPAIPYIWDADDDGHGDVDGIVGVGVGTLFMKKTNETWDSSKYEPHSELEAKAAQEKMVYPEGWTRDNLNAPLPYQPYAVALEYGIGGDIDAPNIEDLAKVLGISVAKIRNIIAGGHNQLEGLVNADNFYDFIVANDNEIRDHTGFYLNTDGSWGENGYPHFTIVVPEDKTTGQSQYIVNTEDVKVYIQYQLERIRRQCLNYTYDQIQAEAAARQAADNALTTYINNSIADIISKIFGTNTISSSGVITWDPAIIAGARIAIGNMNVYSNVDGTETADNFIKTAPDGKGDIRAI